MKFKRWVGKMIMVAGIGSCITAVVLSELTRHIALAGAFIPFVTVGVLMILAGTMIKGKKKNAI